ncbi:MAG: hypothetical protein MJE68_06575, partial [Proteobacteria bacterium]|nr:hypothetical protein [Pseudomonadota bacterium]
SLSLSHIEKNCIGLLSFTLLSLFPPTRSLFDKVRLTFAKTVEPKKYIAFVMGGTILGMGMTVSGAVSLGSCYSLIIQYSSSARLAK